MATSTIRDFIYLDIERVRSFIAQAAEGLISERTSQGQHEMGGQGQVEGGLPFIAKASGSTDYHYTRSQSETKSLHDHIFEELFHKLTEGKQIAHLSDDNKFEWKESFFKDSSFILTRGLIKIVDYQSIITTLQGLPILMEVVAKITSTQQITTPQPIQVQPKNKNRKTNSTPTQPENAELQQMKNQIKSLPLKEIVTLVDQMYGNAVRLKIFPCQNSPENVFVGSAERELFRYIPSSLTNIYGSVIDAGWVSLLQVNIGTHHELGQLTSKTGNQMEDGFEQLADYISNLGAVAQGIKFPAVAVTPIAIYREIDAYHS